MRFIGSLITLLKVHLYFWERPNVPKTFIIRILYIKKATNKNSDDNRQAKMLSGTPYTIGTFRHKHQSSGLNWVFTIGTVTKVRIINFIQ